MRHAWAVYVSPPRAENDFYRAHVTFEWLGRRTIGTYGYGRAIPPLCMLQLNFI